jgi:NADH:ubiquinone reductase (H+-translocating)
MSKLSKGALLLGTGVAAAAAARWSIGQRRGRTARELVEDQTEPTRRIVVLGAGFGGLYAAMRMANAFWDDPTTEVLLIDRQNYHLFTPMLTLVAGSAVEPRHVAFPVRRLLRDHHMNFRRAVVTGIDLDQHLVKTESGEVSYDRLVIALGSVANFFGMDDIGKYGFAFKTANDAIDIRNHIVDCFEQASITQDRALRQELLTFVIVGGGPTGVELAASLHDFIHHTLIEEYPNLSFEREVRILLFEMASRVLPNLEDELARVAARMLRRKSVDLRMNTAISAVSERSVTTKSGEVIPTRTLVWVAGVQANPVVAGLALEKGRGGAMVVDECLRVPNHTGVYALGDNAAYTDPETGKLLPADAKVAIQQAISVGDNVTRELRGEEPVPFKYRRFGDMISLGTNAAVANVLGVKLTGRAAWLLWRTFYLGRLQGTESKFRVIGDWALGTFFEPYTATLDPE